MILDTLAKLTEHFNTEQLTITAERCLNARFKKADCHICADACPVEAIHLDDQSVRLDPEACASCGACVWQCPTEVFAQPHSSRTKLDETVRVVGVVPIELRCPQNTSNTTTIPEVTIIQQPHCLADLSPSRLIELAADRPVWLNDQACAACPIGEAQTSIARAVNEANRWRAVFNHLRQIHLLTTDGDRLARPHIAPIFDSANPPTDRRAFFGLLKKALAETGVAVSEQPSTDDQPVTVNQRLPQRVPRERQNLLTALGTLGQPQDVPLNLPHVSIKAENCTACGLCAKFCPTGSIRFQADSEHFDLDFIPAACIDCNLCVLACPTQAVALTHETEPNRFIRLTATLLIEGDLVPCSVCKKPTATHAGEARCEVCRALPNQQTLTSDLFASLFRSQAKHS